MKSNVLKVHQPQQPFSNNRRQFLKLSGLAVVSSGLLFACSDDDDNPGMPMPGVFDLGKGDLGVLNYAYALEQLEADFYTKVVNGGYWSTASSIEKQVLQDLYYHEVNHRDFFSAAISAAVERHGQRHPHQRQFRPVEPDLGAACGIDQRGHCFVQALASVRQL